MSEKREAERRTEREVRFAIVWHESTAAIQRELRVAFFAVVAKVRSILR